VTVLIAFNGLKLHLVFSPEGDKSLPVVSTTGIKAANGFSPAGDTLGRL
jgi:hypothetical protein